MIDWYGDFADVGCDDNDDDDDDYDDDDDIYKDNDNGKGGLDFY